MLGRRIFRMALTIQQALNVLCDHRDDETMKLAEGMRDPRSEVSLIAEGTRKAAEIILCIGPESLPDIGDGWREYLDVIKSRGV